MLSRKVKVSHNLLTSQIFVLTLAYWMVGSASTASVILHVLAVAFTSSPVKYSLSGKIFFAEDWSWLE